MEQRKIGLFVNPVAGKGRSATLTLQICNRLKEKNIDFDVFESAWPATLHQISEAWIVGGDGTLNYFLNKFTDINLPIAVYKGGTANDFSWKLYGSMSLQRQIEHVLNHQPKPVDAVECNDQIFINGAGIGFDGEVLKSIKTIRFLGGHLGYLWVVIKKIFSFKEYKYQIQFDEQMLSEKFLLVMVTNSSRAGGGFMVSPAADITDAKLDMVLCKPLPVLKRLQYLPVIEKGKHLDKDFILHRQISNVKIVCEQDTLAQLDGELIRGSMFNITVLPKRYLFIY